MKFSARTKWCAIGGVVIAIAVLVAVLWIDAARRTAEINRRNLQVIEFFLRNDPFGGEYDSPLYLTNSKREVWSESGNWSSLPDSFHARISDLSPTYHPASQARMDHSAVFDRETGEASWMRWVAVLEWKSEAKVIIETGIRGGSPCREYGAIFCLGEKDDQWEIDELALDRWSYTLTEDGWK